MSYSSPRDFSPHPVAPPDPLVSRDFDGWLRRVTAMVKASWRPLALVHGVLAVISLPVFIWSQFEQLDATARQEEAAAGEKADLGAALAGLLVAVPALLVVVVLGTLATVVGVQVVVRTAHTGRAQLDAALRNSWRRLLPMWGWGAPASLLILLGLCACVLPAIYLGAVFALLPAVVVLERTNALARCFRLFHNDLGAALARVGCWAVASVVVNVVVTMATIVATLALSAVPVAAAVVGGLGSAVAMAAVGIVTAPVLVCTYADLRGRLEPTSTPQLAAALDA